ncbi:MAG: peptidylprolyl isomerase [bacterium]
MSKATQGDTVVVHYTGKLEDGSIFDSSIEREPLQFTIGDGQLIPGFEQGIIGMAPGESKSITIPPESAYGEHNAELVWEIDKKELPDGLNAEIGQKLQSVQNDGKKIIMTVMGVSDSSVTLDANHPLAGKELIFDIQLMEIV